ncbi:MAG TPA: murein L,D-transpeptidase catalytic domain family protein [Chitinophagaceae bacterium]
MTRKLKKIYFIISSLFITLLHLPFLFAKSASGSNKLVPQPAPAPVTNFIDSPAIAVTVAASVYDSLRLEYAGLNRKAFDYAKKGFDKLVAQGKIINNSILSIVDFSQPSSHKRLFIIDLKNYKMLFNTWVAHGRNSGREMANSFSNENSSFKSSPGFYVTREPYNGGHGYSLKLDGLEKGINDNASERAIVLHGANYVNPSYISMQGFIGRSLGCPAVPVKMATPIINTIKNGTCLFIYSPAASYLQHSATLG